MPCKDCYNNCAGQKVSDECVMYTGEDIPLLGICYGDPLIAVEEAFIEKFLSIFQGHGIFLNDLTFANAPWLLPILGTKDKTLQNIVQLLIDTSQTLKDLVTATQRTPTSFSTACLTGLPANPTTDQILQATLNTLCTLKTTVNAFSSTYVKASDLPSLVTNIVNPTGSGTVVNYNNRMVPNVAYEYYGSLSNFDNTGKGLAAYGFDKVYLCNGQNGTPDKRGRVAVGATKNVPGGTLDAAVSPTSPQNSTGVVDYAVGDKFGENFHPLTNAESAPHTHGVNDPGHDHSLPTDTTGTTNMKAITETPNADEGYSSTTPTGTSKTNITIASSGGGQPHNNRQPSIAANFIMYIPI